VRTLSLAVDIKIKKGFSKRLGCNNTTSQKHCKNKIESIQGVHASLERGMENKFKV
jgi:hypothetical protein